MSRYSSETGSGDFVQAPAGSHMARCYRIIDIGTQETTGEFAGKLVNQVHVSWELPGELMEDGQPFTVSKFFTNSLHVKAGLRKTLVSWRGREFTAEELAKFDLQNVLGAPCMLSVVHTDKGKAKVDAVMKLPKGMVCPPQVNPSEAFWLDEFNQEMFNKLPDFFKTMIAKSPEYKELGSEPVVYEREPGDDDDDIAF